MGNFTDKENQILMSLVLELKNQNINSMSNI